MKSTSQILQNIKAVVWDYDGVHYDYATFPPLKFFDDIRTRVAMRILPVLDEEQAYRIGEEGYKLYGDTVHGYTLWAKENGHDVAKIREKIFKGYHSDLFNYLVKNYPDRITRDADTVSAFNRCAAVVQHGIATHSSIEHWTRPFLERQDLLQFFNEKALIGLDDVGYVRKSESTAAILRALEPLGVAQHQAAFAEDTLENLRHAHASLPGLTTIFIHHGKPLETLPPFVTVQSRNPGTVMQDIALAHNL